MRKLTTFEKHWRKELKFWNSQEGEELQYCLVAQGFKTLLLRKLMVLFGSGFTALKIIQNIEEVIK